MQIRDLRTKATELELMPLVEKPVPRICKIPTKAREPADEDSKQTAESGGTSRQAIKDNSDGREASSDNVKVGNLEESLPRFGPFYSVDQPSVDATKENAWTHVLNKSLDLQGTLEEQKVTKDAQNVIKKAEEVIKEKPWELATSEAPKAVEEARGVIKDAQGVTKEIYLKAMRKVEQKAKDLYADKKISSVLGSNFRWMMIKDGCFFLQLALLVLGCCEQLGYPSNDPIFGRVPKRKDVKKWVEAMFYVGNQIPLVVLRELMNQKFFQDVVTKKKWDPSPSGLCRKVLYEVLVLPALKRDKHGFPIKSLMGIGNKDVDKEPSDLLHALQNLVIGPAPLNHLYQADDQVDLEANEEDIGEYERSIFPGTIHDEERTSASDITGRVRIFLRAIGLPDAVEDRKRIFPCATELKRAGIRIKKLKRGGVRSIHFKSYYLWAFLYLPAFPVDDNTELIFRNLKLYENFQHSGRNRREVGSYLKVMSDIIQTTRDAKLLQKKGIIEAGNSDDVEKLPEVLNRLSSDDTRILTQELRILRSQIRDYSSPWIHYRGVINLVLFLTLIQTLLALLAYLRPPKP